MRLAPLHLIVSAHTLEVEGFDKHSALKRCGLSPDDLPEEDDEWVHVSQFAKLIDAILAETKNPAFGLVAGKSLALTRFAMFTPLTVFTLSLRQFLEDIHKFSALVLERPEFMLIEKQGKTYIDIHPILLEGHTGRYRYDFVVTSVVQVLRFFGLGHDDIHAIEVPYACEPDLMGRYLDAWGTKPQFNANACRVTFNPAQLDKPHPGHDPMGYAAARMRVESALTARMSRIDTAEKVRQRLLSAFPDQPALLETARHLGLSERSLRRHLAALDTSYQELAQECQFLKARGLLAENQLSIKQIADALGFASVTSFHRAFKRWTGTTPLLWRDEQPIQ